MEIPAGAQIFDLVFHPTFATVYAGLLTGHIKAFAYDDHGNHESLFTVRPSKRSCRGLGINEDGTHLYAVGKGKQLSIIDTKTQSVDTRTQVHDSPINRVKCVMRNLISTGDDDGVIKLWDPRKRDCIRTYSQHFDYITDFLWLDDKKQLVATSGDGSLSVIDVRSKQEEPVAHSEDQEDELLSIVAIKSGTKAVVGTQLGILSIFNRNKGWGDCVDRVPGHPMSIEALCNIPGNVPNVDSGSTILTGSSDGYVRAVQLFPTKLLGVVTDHGEWPVERIAVGEILRMSNLDTFFCKERHADRSDSDGDGEGALGDIPENEKSENNSENEPEVDVPGVDSASDQAADSDEPEPPKAKKRKLKPEKDPLKVKKKKKSRNTVEIDGAFFNDL
ncbi:WD repeat-containing protein JIP5 [Amanita muscaria]